MNSTNYKNIDFHSFPDELGRFGNYGGRFVAETLMPLLIDVEKEYLLAKNQNHLTNNSIIIFLTMLVDQVHYILPKDFQKNLIMQKFILKEMNLTTLVLTKLIIVLVKYFLQLEWGKKEL